MTTFGNWGNVGHQKVSLPGAPCANCGLREGTVKWGDAVAQIHDHWQWWCRICALDAQLAFAKQRAAAIPDLEVELADAYEAEGGTKSDVDT